MTIINMVFDLGQGGSIEYVALNLKKWMTDVEVNLVDFRDPDPPYAHLTHYVVGFNQHADRPVKLAQPALMTLHHLDWDSPAESKKAITNVAIATMSGEWRRLMLAMGVPAEVLRLIPHGIDLDFWQPQERNVDEKFTIGIVAASYDNGRKGEKLLPRIFELLASLDIRLVIVGKGWAATVRDLRSMGVDVEWREAVAIETLRKIYQDCSVYLCASYVEGGPLPLLEAMAMGVTPVSTPVGLARDILPGTQLGYLYPKGNALFAASIIKKLYQGQLDFIPQDKMRKTLQDYTWQQAAKKYEVFYRQIIAQQALPEHQQTHGYTVQKRSRLSFMEWVSLVASPLPTDPRTQPWLWRGINVISKILDNKLSWYLLDTFPRRSAQTKNIQGGKHRASAAAQNAGGPVRLPADSHLSIIDEQGLVFIESTQKLFGLNTFATFLWCCLEEGLDVPDAVKNAQQTFSIPLEQAQSYIDKALQDWRQIGLLNPHISSIKSDAGSEIERLTGVGPMPPLPQVCWQAHNTLRLLDSKIELFMEDAKFEAMIRPIVGHLYCQPGPDGELTQGTIHVCLLKGNIGIYRDGRPVAYFADKSALGPSVKSIMLQMAIDHSSSQFYFHAGVLSNGEQLVMLPGAAGSGKSTLTAGLMHAGLCYYSDEVALFSPDNPAIRPFPIALCSKSTAWPTLEALFSDFSTLPDYVRLDNKRVRYQPPKVNLSDPQYDRALTVRSLVFPRYSPDVSTQLIPISRVDALQRLMEECLAVRKPLTISDVEGLAQWIGSVDCYELPNSSLHSSVGSIMGLMS